MQRSLADAVAWTHSPQFDPDALNNLEGLSGAYPVFPVKWDVVSPDRVLGDVLSPFISAGDAVEKIVLARRSLLSEAEKHQIDSDGRLFVCEPQCSIWDGLSAWQSDGFFNDVDIPPSWTWVAYLVDEEALATQIAHPKQSRSSLDFLVGYVPAKYVKAVDKGICANATACIRWCDRTFIEKNRLLRFYFEQLEQNP